MFQNADQAAMFLMELPELLAYVYLIWFFSKHLFLNIYRKARCRQCEGSSFDLTVSGSKCSTKSCQITLLPEAPLTFNGVPGVQIDKQFTTVLYID